MKLKRKQFDTILDIQKASIDRDHFNYLKRKLLTEFSKVINTIIVNIVLFFGRNVLRNVLKEFRIKVVTIFAFAYAKARLSHHFRFLLSLLLLTLINN